MDALQSVARCDVERSVPKSAFTADYDDFYAQEAEMERQLGTDIKTVWLNKLGSARRACRVARA